MFLDLLIKSDSVEQETSSVDEQTPSIVIEQVARTQFVDTSTDCQMTHLKMDLLCQKIATLVAKLNDFAEKMKKITKESFVFLQYCRCKKLPDDRKLSMPIKRCRDQKVHPNFICQKKLKLIKVSRSSWVFQSGCRRPENSKRETICKARLIPLTFTQIQMPLIRAIHLNPLSFP